ncbi:MAG: hypothetical protein C0507_12215 [Cyanobacteria bacterium PR.3.49]|nr:hypothetical protein [Cyanobacteria bacterium PR.3.49]
MLKWNAQMQVVSIEQVQDFLNSQSADTELEIHRLPKGTHLPELPSTLKKLAVIGCASLIELPALPPSLDELYIADCPELTALPELTQGLTYVHLVNLPRLSSLPNFPESLRIFLSVDCRGLHKDAEERKLRLVTTTLIAWRRETTTAPGN